MLTPGIDTFASPLTIDTHCHIFNGTDLQAAAFIGKVLVTEKGIAQPVLEAIGDLVQFVNWSIAPNGDAELALLRRLRALRSETEVRAAVSEQHEASYQIAKRAILQKRVPSLPAAANGAGLKGAAHVSSKEDVLREIYGSFELPSYAEHVAKQQADAADLNKIHSQMKAEARPADQIDNKVGTGFSLLGVTRYLSQCFQFRYVSAQDYLDTFTPAAQRGVDLMLASLVDYDWWLAKGLPTKTPLPQQISVMEQISILSRGQVHAFVPFDPLREVAFRAGKTGASWSSLLFVQTSVRTRGSIGVKLYPPMGFAPYGNETVGTPLFWKQADLPDWLDESIYYKQDGSSRSFGARLDEALSDLYSWCCAEGVPILAHSNTTNGVVQQFRDLAAAQYWARALERFPNLQVSFGHLGDFSASTGSSVIPPASEAYIKLFRSPKPAASDRRFGDSAYDAEVLRDYASLSSRFRSAYNNHSSPGNDIIASRLMYGTDWNLLMTAGRVEAYMKSFQDIFEGLGAGHLADGERTVAERFFGWNAVDFIGLRRGQPARVRLESFYRLHGLDFVTDPPTWMRKVDS